MTIILDENDQQDLEQAFTCKHKGKFSKYTGRKIIIDWDCNGLGLPNSHNMYCCAHLLRNKKPQIDRHEKYLLLSDGPL